MISISKLKENKDDYTKLLGKRGKSFDKEIDRALDLDSQKRQAQTELQEISQLINEKSKLIGELFKKNMLDEANKLKDEASVLKENQKIANEKFAELDSQFKNVILEIPNVPNKIVPKGKNEEDNEIIFQSGKIDGFSDSLLPHWEITDKYNLIDFDAGSKITGAGFPLYIDKGAKLQRSLVSFFLDKNTEAGYKEFLPPFVVNEESGFGTGQLPDKEGQMYHMQTDNLYLIPTSEVPITNIYRDKILNEDELPIKCTSYSPCFRREAGSYGINVRGLNRLHQFEKVEIVRIEKPENSHQVLDEMVDHIKYLLNQLELPYRIVRLCGGDLGFTSCLTYDFEVYSAGQKRWLEVSSVSNFEDFQSRRLKLRYKDKGGNKIAPHTLNGSALALPRIVAAILENNQTKDGVQIPKNLQPFTNFDLITN